MQQNVSIKPEEPQLISISIGTIQFGYHLLSGIQEVQKLKLSNHRYTVVETSGMGVLNNIEELFDRPDFFVTRLMKSQLEELT